MPKFKKGVVQVTTPSIPPPPDNLFLNPILYQQKNESDKSYGYWIGYRDMPRGERELLSFSKTVKAGYEGIQKSSQRHKWRERIIAWEAHLTMMRMAQLYEAGIETNERHIKVGKMMTSKAIIKLQNTAPADFTVQQALRYLVEGIRIERDAYALNRSTGREISDDRDLNVVDIQEITGFTIGDPESNEADNNSNSQAGRSVSLAPTGSE